MSASLDSEKFNPQHHFIGLLQKHDLNPLINESNHLFSETKSIDSDLNTLVYENYTKFISATDLTHSINMSLSSDEITNDLEDLKGNLKSINAGHQEIE